MLGKIWKGSKKVLAFALALVMVVGVMQTVSMVRAAEEQEIKFESQSCYIAEGTLKLKLKVTGESGKKIKYYLHQWEQNRALDKLMEDGNYQEVYNKVEKSMMLVTDSVIDVVDRREILAWYVNDQEEPYFYEPNAWYWVDINDLLCRGKIEDNGEDWTTTSIVYDEKGVLSVPFPEGSKKVNCMVYRKDDQGVLGEFVDWKGTEFDLNQADNHTVEFDLQNDLNQSGDYVLCLWVDKANARTKIFEKSITYEAKDPLPNVKDIQWDTQKAGTVKFTMENQTNVQEYKIILYRKFSDGRQEPFNAEWIAKTEGNEAKTYECDMKSYMMDYSANYLVGIRAISTDLSQNSNSAEVVSGTYNFSGVSDTVKGNIAAKLGLTETSSIQEVINKVQTTLADTNKEEVVTALKDVSGNLRIAMQMKEDMVALVSAIEDKTGKKATVEINGNDIFAADVTNNSIDVVGAGVDVQTQRTLKVEAVEGDVTVDAKYQKTVPLEIKLKEANNSDVSTLSIPVSITMPVPKGIDESKLVILHMGKDEKNLPMVDEVIYPRLVGGRITFTVSHFSTFVFAEDEDKPVGDGSGNNTSTAPTPRGGRQDAAVEALITVAEAGATIKTKDITTLANSTMKALLKRGDVTLVMEYTYKGVDYVITIPAGAAVDDDIPWYGPLYLAGKYGNGGEPANTDKVADKTYVVKRGDTMQKIAKMSGMSLAELAAKNPQIKNLNRIKVGQTINR